MNAAWKRRLIRMAIVLIFFTIAYQLTKIVEFGLHSSAHFTGWVLMGTIIFLMLLSLRKRIRIFPVGSAELWLQVHIYVGFFSGLLFMTHIAWKIPNGIHDLILATVFMITFLSGVFGIFLSRILAKRLTTRGSETLYSQIPSQIDLLNQQVKESILNCASSKSSTALGQLYLEQLDSFFSGPKNVWHHMLQSNRPGQELLSSLDGFARYLDVDEKETLGFISEKVSLKNSLDYQYANQTALKAWLFVHVPMTYSLIVFALVHGVSVVAYSGAIL